MPEAKQGRVKWTPLDEDDENVTNEDGLIVGSVVPSWDPAEHKVLREADFASPSDYATWKGGILNKQIADLQRRRDNLFGFAKTCAGMSAEQVEAVRVAQAAMNGARALGVDVRGLFPEESEDGTEDE